MSSTNAPKERVLLRLRGDGARHIIVADGKAPFLILSVGGFLGIGTKLVAVPHESLRVQDKKLLLPGATKDALKDLPEFHYAKD